jgi:hypothetical protein
MIRCIYIHKYHSVTISYNSNLLCRFAYKEQQVIPVSLVCSRLQQLSLYDYTL